VGFLGYNDNNKTKGGPEMTAIEQKVLNLIGDMPETELVEVIDFIGYLKIKRERDIFKDLMKASESSLDFWDNEIDAKIWDNI
jgi:hypothetical protein